VTVTVTRQTFHQQIAHNKRRSLLLLAAMIAILALLGWFFGIFLTGDPADGVIAVPFAIALATFLAAGAWFSGDSLVLSASRARQVGEADAPQLMNVVREMSIAADVPMPRVHIIEDAAPNAFATGRDPEHASIAVTTGLLQKLDREELQGVIGHELAHVRNFDIRFALLVGVVVGSIALLADMMARMAFWGGMGRRGGGRRSGGGGGGAILILFFLGLLLAILAPLFARLLQMAVNRQREYLADASAVEITRNPAGLERALVKIASDREPLEVANRATQHLYIVNPIKKLDESARGLFSTHPAIIDRVNRLRQLTGQPALDQRGLAALQGLD
jgi:heat shock protein HtpX